MTSAFKFNMGRSTFLNVMSSSRDNETTAAKNQQTAPAIVKQDSKPAASDLKTNVSDAKPVNKNVLISMYKEKAKNANSLRRIFLINGAYPTLRRELAMRGWVEKLQPGQHPFLESLPEDVLVQHARNGNDYERVLLSRYLQRYPPYFVWRMPSAAVPEVQPYRNLVRNRGLTDFTSKTGLIGCAEQELWYQQEGVCAMSYPRFYRLSNSFEERKAFIEDFRLTQCQSLLRYIVEKVEECSKLADFEKGTIPFFILEFALSRVRNKLEDKEHRTLDNNEKIDTDCKDEVEDWKDFIINSYQVLNLKGYFKATQQDIEDFALKAKYILKKLEKKYPTCRWDGYRNVWILKPGYQCRGIGIVLRTKLDEILTFSANHLHQRYIVQKYVERPFLIYRTKFDIRQYLLITIDKTKIYLWLYRDCYLKFSSSEFSLDDLNEQIHLTNNTVQKKYRNNINRDYRLPNCNMWSLEQFKHYLKEQNIGDKAWEKRIFPGFKENIIAVVMAGLEDIEVIPNTFDLFGCDFMLDSELYPILIEINSTPDMTPSTNVTARLCPRVLKDMIKGVVDVPEQNLTAAGQFELIYEIKYGSNKRVPPNMNFQVSGKAMKIQTAPVHLMSKLFPTHVFNPVEKRPYSKTRWTK